jgi:integrase/recombinase XerD
VDSQFFIGDVRCGHRSPLGPAKARPSGSRLSLEVPDGRRKSLNFPRSGPAGVHRCRAARARRLFARELEARGWARATVIRRLSTIAGFYRYAVEEELRDHSPAAHVRRPRVDYESHATALDRNEVGALLFAAGLGPAAEHALVPLLALNGLRVSEATGADIEHLGLERGYRTLVITRKGGKVVTIPLAPRTGRAIDLAIGERASGPLFLSADSKRLDRHGAARMVRGVTRRAGIIKQVSPHALRHAFITAALDAGVPLRDVQEDASHADPRTPMRYDRARTSLGRHATYIVATYIAGAARYPWKPARPPTVARPATIRTSARMVAKRHLREQAGTAVRRGRSCLRDGQLRHAALGDLRARPHCEHPVMPVVSELRIVSASDRETHRDAERRAVGVRGRFFPGRMDLGLAWFSIGTPRPPSAGTRLARMGRRGPRPARSS